VRGLFLCFADFFCGLVALRADEKTNARAGLRRRLRQRSGFLHCATHDETVGRFGRNDDSLFCAKTENNDGWQESVRGLGVESGAGDGGSAVIAEDRGWVDGVAACVAVNRG
jgi:hypothetical protein